MAESAWEPLSISDLTVCAVDGCRRIALWVIKDHVAGNCAPNLECYVCNTHKAEPQPPTYSEWLAVQA